MSRKLLLAAALGTTLLAGCAATGGGTPIDDSELTARIRQELSLDPLLNSSGITVTENDGNIVVAGFVDKLEDLDAIRETIEGVEGVRSVETDVIVQGGN